MLLVFISRDDGDGENTDDDDDDDILLILPQSVLYDYAFNNNND